MSDDAAGMATRKAVLLPERVVYYLSLVREQHRSHHTGDNDAAHSG